MNLLYKFFLYKGNHTIFLFVLFIFFIKALFIFRKFDIMLVRRSVISEGNYVFQIERRTNFHRLGGGGSRSYDATSTDDNNAYGNLGKL